MNRVVFNNRSKTLTIWKWDSSFCSFRGFNCKRIVVKKAALRGVGGLEFMSFLKEIAYPMLVVHSGKIVIE